MDPNDKWVGDLTQHDYDDLLARNHAMRVALDLADGSLTWCRARHGSDEVTDEAIRAVLAITRRRA